MKNQNTTNKLAFNKAIVTELNKNQMTNIQGGSTGAVCDAVGDVIDAINDAITAMTKPMLK